jgi:hypothetical protein
MQQLQFDQLLRWLFSSIVISSNYLAMSGRGVCSGCQLGRGVAVCTTTALLATVKSAEVKPSAEAQSV